ncbi:MAG TPA: hypothetical protein PKC24_12485 [Cyclobacteriaceae bacterium]|nr:hypothetical protein [Cyclobacteriaceae bacterium]
MQLFAFGQQDSIRHSVKYYSSLQFGMLFNCIDCDTNYQSNASITMQHGISFNEKYVVALGLGRESYGQLRSSPVILHLEKSAKGLSGRYGFALDAGFTRLKYKNGELWNWIGTLERGTGTILHPQFFMVAGEKKTKLFTSIGYKYVWADLEYDNWGLPNLVDMSISRLTVQIGLRIN